MPQDPNDSDWGDNKVAPFNYYVREVFTRSDQMDNFDLDSTDEKSCQAWRQMCHEYVEQALKLIELIAKDPEGSGGNYETSTNRP
jgi:hypothetical protein